MEAKTQFNGSLVQVGVSNRGMRGESQGGAGKLWLTIPLTFDGLPAGTSALPVGWTATFEAPDGATWREDRLPWANQMYDTPLPALHTHIDWAFFTRAKNLPIKVHGTLYLALFGNLAAFPLNLQDRQVAVPGGGTCSLRVNPDGNKYVSCDSAFRSPNNLAWISWSNPGSNDQDDRSSLNVSDSPFPADPGISPIRTLIHLAGSPSSTAVQIHTLKPLAYFKRDFQVSGWRLADLQRY